MSQTQFSSPTSIQDAIQSLASGKGTTKVLAGGTDLLVQMRLNLHDIDLVVDVKKIATDAKAESAKIKKNLKDEE